MEESDFKERRCFVRIKISLDVRLRQLEKDLETRGLSYDVSAKGIGIFIKDKLEDNTPVEIWIENPAKEKTVYLKGKVVWAKSVDGSTYRVGIEAEHVDLINLASLLE